MHNNNGKMRSLVVGVSVLLHRARREHNGKAATYSWFQHSGSRDRYAG